MKGWINSSKEPEAMLRGAFDLGAGAGASAILASPGCGGCPGRGALCRGVLLGCERWLALALRPRAARSCLCGRLCRGGALLFGVKRVFSPGPMPGDVSYGPPSAVGTCGGGRWRFGGPEWQLGEFFVCAGGMTSLGARRALFRWTPPLRAAAERPGGDLRAQLAAQSSW